MIELLRATRNSVPPEYDLHDRSGYETQRPDSTANSSGRAACGLSEAGQRFVVKVDIAIRPSRNGDRGGRISALKLGVRLQFAKSRRRLA